jgi:hypothetical protein
MYCNYLRTAKKVHHKIQVLRNTIQMNEVEFELWQRAATFEDPESEVVEVRLKDYELKQLKFACQAIS